ncbi:hypothetical protein [Nocardioides marinquilinus]|uniref:hypothetical protein n=1 Tax=Nocardioides marinquilinus TaxID=1210400 RepID=UPI0031E955CA
MVGEHRPDGRAIGTPGRDVIVTNGAKYVRAFGGDDLICVTNLTDFPRAGVVHLEAAGGDDRVVVTGSSRRAVWAALGAGADRFTGGPGDDEVLTGPGEVGGWGPDGDREQDVVSTARGDDVVQTKGSAGRPDRIDLGHGDDRVEVRDPDGGRVVVAGGEGRDALVVGRGSTAFSDDLTLDNRDGSATRDGAAWITWTGVQDFRVDTSGTLDFRGGPLGEHLVTSEAAAASTIAMGAGLDVVTLDEGRGPSTLDGGAGDDRLELSVRGSGGAEPVVVDVADGTVVPSRAGLTFTRFDDVFVSDLTLTSVTLRGSGADDVLSASGCEITIEGRGGDDRLTSVRTYDQLGDYPCSDAPTLIEGPATMDGGPGDDVLVGSGFGDRLDGGDGDDTVDGRAGTDTCLGETRVRCEA